MKQKVLLAAVAASLLTPGLSHAQSGESIIGASNFGYSTIGADLGKVMLDDDIVLVNEVYEEFALGALAGSLQVADNFALYAGGEVFLNDGPNTEMTQTVLSAGIQTPIGIGDRVDIVPMLGIERYELEICIDGYCGKEDESTAVYGIGARIWAVADTLEVSIGIKDGNDDDYESEVSIGAHGWINDHHRVGIDYRSEEELSAVSLGYRYVFW